MFRYCRHTLPFPYRYPFPPFSSLYSNVHPFLSFVLCVLGLAANAIHITVLTRPRMRHSSVHTVLVCIAISDMGTMTSYLVSSCVWHFNSFLLQMYISRFEFLSDKEGYSYFWALFLKCHAMLSIALHAITLYLVVLMAFIRLSAMKLTTSRWLDHTRTLWASQSETAHSKCFFAECAPSSSPFSSLSCAYRLFWPIKSTKPQGVWP